MKQIQLTITAKAPLAIGQRKPGSVSEAMDYIPGTVIRGAIAQKILQYSNDESPSPEDDFHRLFLDENGAIFQNAYPAIAKTGEDTYEESADPVRLLPATALSSKTDSGFKPKKAGVFDSLIDSFCAREHGLFYEPNSKEGDRVDPFSGFYSKEENGIDKNGQLKHRYYPHSVSKRLLTRVGINRRRATAQDEILYSIEVLDESQGKGEHNRASVYRGHVLLPDNDHLAAQFMAFIIESGDRFRLGGSASRGLGKVSIEADEIPGSSSSVSQRINSFNRKLKERWSTWNIFGQPSSDKDKTKDQTFFTVDFQADAILTERWRRTMVIAPDMLGQWVGLSSAKVELHMAYSGYDYRSGWNAAWGLPKDMELITKMGSVFLFSVPDSQIGDWYDKLAELELKGVGDRTSEGFGQIKICDDFHQILWEVSV